MNPADKKLKNSGNQDLKNQLKAENENDSALENIKAPFQTVKGVHDILPDDHDYHTYIKKIIRHRSRQAGFRRITTPLLEYTEVFKKSIGEITDLVANEMYSFEDPTGHSVTLKPEGTAGICRSYVQNGMHNLPQPVELYYYEPNFRFDKLQAGRYRQFWQFGFEIIGECDPALDAQAIYLAHKIYKDLGIADTLKLQINNIGDPESRQVYEDALRDYYYGKERYLSDDDKLKLKVNPMRILDSKHEDTIILNQSAPRFSDYLSQECKDFDLEVKDYLNSLGLEFIQNDNLVRGLDYYTRTVFEFWDNKKGGQNTIGAGGRYDGLIELMGGQPTPALGFAMGIERVIAQMKREKIRVPRKDDLHVFVAQLGREAKKRCLPLIMELRESGIKTMGALGKGAIKNQLGLADKFKAPYAVIMGLTEVRENTAIIRNMQKGTQVTVPIENVVEEIIKRIGANNLDFYDTSEPAES